MFSFDPHFVPFNDHGFLRQVACITRLVPQKGLHLIRHAIYKTAELGGQFVLLGSSPVPHIQREFEGVADQFQKNNNIRLILKYDEALSHCIYAASDMFIIPSMFEPCGLTQVIYPYILNYRSSIYQPNRPTIAKCAPVCPHSLLGFKLAFVSYYHKAWI
jgi:glycosyltransferase involved in cell wall biosynthesis